MQQLDRAGLVWNRACLGGGSSPREGDRALAAMLRLHGLVMNGGVQHAVEVLDGADVEAACAGFEYFGLAAAAAAVRRAVVATLPGDAPIDQSEQLEEALNAAYWSVVPDDDALANAYQAHLRDHPSAYAPVE